MSGHYYPSPDIDPAPLPMATHPGQHINDAVRRAVAMAGEHKRRVSFAFNDVSMTVDPDDTEDDVLARWEADNTARAPADPCAVAAAVKAEREAIIAAISDIRAVWTRLAREEAMALGIKRTVPTTAEAALSEVLAAIRAIPLED